jgi:hypothetical protein
MQVIKSSGEKEKFNPNKIYHSILEAGGSKKLAKNAIKEVKQYYEKNFTTKEILLILLKFLKQEPGISEKYDLKRAIMSLGPTGFAFEQFFAEILNHYDYKTKIGEKIKGKKIMQEIDVIAIKKKKIMIECKYHNEKGIITKLQPAMYTHARFLDVKHHGFDESWLVTNTNCSRDALNYSIGVNQKIISWKYPSNESLQKLIEKQKLYPITIIKSLKQETKENLYRANITIAKDLLNYTIKDLKRKTLLSEKEIEKILKEVKEIIG